MAEKDAVKKGICGVWYKTSGEDPAGNLLMKGIKQHFPDSYSQMYLPMKAMLWKDKSAPDGEFVEVLKPLFQGYFCFFMDTDDVDAFRQMLEYVVKESLSGIAHRRKICEPVCLSEEEAGRLRHLIGPNHTAGISRGIKKDGKVEFLGGPAAGMEKFIKRIDRHKHIAILTMDFLGEKVEFTISVDIA